MKIDAMPSRVLIADSYYLFDFLEISEEDLRKTIQEHGHGSFFAASRLIEYWVDRIGKIEKGQQVFIVFDLSDQYISGLLLKKLNEDFKPLVYIQMKYAEEFLIPISIKL